MTEGRRLLKSWRYFKASPRNVLLSSFKSYHPLVECLHWLRVFAVSLGWNNSFQDTNCRQNFLHIITLQDFSSLPCRGIFDDGFNRRSWSSLRKWTVYSYQGKYLMLPTDTHALHSQLFIKQIIKLVFIISWGELLQVTFMFSKLSTSPSSVINDWRDFHPFTNVRMTHLLDTCNFHLATAESPSAAVVAPISNSKRRV